ncbi:MAG: hypothetical protein ACREVO_01455 [Steroidobacteraceae bacterium]
MRHSIWQAISLIAVTIAASGLARASAPQSDGINAPRVFSPGVISGPANDAAATFTPDGRTVYFFRNNGDDYDIMTSRFDGKRWSQPKIAPFSGHWRDLEPAMAPDGSYLIFASSRPIDGSGKPIDGHWGGQLHPGRGGHLWRVNRRGAGWSAPFLLPVTVNRFDSTFSPAIAADGSLYFMAATGSGGHFQLYCSPFEGGQYQRPELLPFSAGQYGGVDPAVAPDQSFIVFASGRPPAPVHVSYVFVAFRNNGHWQDPIPLGPAVNGLGSIDELRLGPDGHTLYLTSNYVMAPGYPKTTAASVAGLQSMQSWNDGNDNIWEVDLAPWLQRVEPPRPVTLNGIIHSDSDDTLAFTPDGNTVFFDRSRGKHKTIMVARRMAGRWSAPQVASFSGHWFDQDPVIAPDGSYLLFDSDRPVRPGGQPLQQDYFVGGVGPGSNLWRVDRQGARWGRPHWLGPTINSDAFVDFASIAADNTLYFMLWDKKAKVMHILRSEYRDGRYQVPQSAGIGTPAVSDHDPAVAPDQSFVVFDLGKTKGGLGRLCIAFREDGGWGKPMDLGDVVNKDVPWGSHLAPDGHTVYFTGQSGIWRLSLQPWLRRHDG